MDGNFLTIIFGLTSGILTLVGITSIFVSINSQHNIQKGRELVWKIMSLPLEANNYTDVLIAEKMCQYYWLYKDIVGTSKNFTKNIIYITQFAIAVVGLFWVSCLWFFFSAFYVILVGLSVIILILYILAIRKLNDITQIADLPIYNNLLDGNAHLRLNIHVPALAAYGATITIREGDSFDFDVIIGTNLPFFNLKVSTIITARNFKTSYIEILGEEKVILLDGEGRLSLGIPNLWYKLIEFNVKDAIIDAMDVIDFQLIFSSEYRYSTAHYILKKQDLKELKSSKMFSLLPKVVDNNYVLSEDKSMMPWGLND